MPDDTTSVTPVDCEATIPITPCACWMCLKPCYPAAGTPNFLWWEVKRTGDAVTLVPIHINCLDLLVSQGKKKV